MDLSSLQLVSAIFFAIGTTLVGFLILLHFILIRYRQGIYPQNVLGYGENGQTPSVIRRFQLVKEDEFV